MRFTLIDMIIWNLILFKQQEPGKESSQKTEAKLPVLFHNEEFSWRLKELPYWFYQFSVHTDAQNTSVLAQRWLYVAWMLLRDKILTINVLCRWLLFKINGYKVYCWFRKPSVISQSDIKCSDDNLFNDQETLQWAGNEDVG